MKYIIKWVVATLIYGGLPANKDGFVPAVLVIQSRYDSASIQFDNRKEAFDFYLNKVEENKPSSAFGDNGILIYKVGKRWCSDIKIDSISK